MFGQNYTDFHELGAASVWEILVPPAVAMIFILTGTVVKLNLLTSFMLQCAKIHIQ